MSQTTSIFCSINTLKRASGDKTIHFDPGRSHTKHCEWVLLVDFRFKVSDDGLIDSVNLFDCDVDGL